jgi:hypothetical protein
MFLDPPIHLYSFLSITLLLPSLLRLTYRIPLGYEPNRQSLTIAVFFFSFRTEIGHPGAIARHHDRNSASNNSRNSSEVQCNNKCIATLLQQQRHSGTPTSTHHARPQHQRRVQRR